MNQARSRAIDRLRFEQRKKRTNPDTQDPPLAFAAEDSARLLDLKEQGRFLRHALMLLTTDERAAIEAAFFSELTYAEVAQSETVLHLLHGELWIDDRTLHPGDYNRAEPGTSDARVWSETGCTCLLTTSPLDELR